MQQQSVSQKKFLAQTIQTYRDEMAGSPAEAYLVQRGFTEDLLETVSKAFHLGYVGTPAPADHSYKGRLVIPYRRWHPRLGWHYITCRYRACDNTTNPKYLSRPGDSPHLFNTPALVADRDVIGVCEGELDAIAASLAGLPSIGIPGVASAQAHWYPLLQGYRRVIMLRDGDEPGEQLARTLAQQLPNLEVVELEPGNDVAGYMQVYGFDALKEKIAELTSDRVYKKEMSSV